MPFPKGASRKMANKAASCRCTELAALVTAMADLFERFLSASGVELPQLAESLQRIQEIAYGTVPTKEQRDFGLTYAASQGIVPPTDNGNTVGTGEQVAVQQ